MQSLAPALYPVFRNEYSLSFAQVGVITLVFQITASLLQPLIGLVTDRRPTPWALPFAMGFTLFGLVLLAFSRSYPMLLVSVGFIGIGSAVFHPEASRAARAASGGRHGFAQSLFQVGGNFGQSLGPLMAAFIVVPQRAEVGARLHRAGFHRDPAAQRGSHAGRSRAAPPSARSRRSPRRTNCRAAWCGARWRCWWCCCSPRCSIWPASTAITRSI